MLESEPDLQRHLEVSDVAVFDMTARFHYLEPVDVLDGLAGVGNGITDGVVAAGRCWRCSACARAWTLSWVE